MSSRYQELCRAKGARLQSLAGPTLDSLCEQPAFAEVVSQAREGQLDLEKARSWLNRDLLHALMRGALLDRLPFEYLLTALRAHFLAEALQQPINPDDRALRVSLALQCFSNDHAWFEEECEQEQLGQLFQQVESGQAQSEQLLVYAMYRPLAKLSPELVQPLRGDCPHLGDLMVRAYDEPRAELEILGQLEKLGEINDETSLRVQEQYSTSPYPRWWVEPPANPRPLSQSLSEWYPEVSDWDGAANQILIAGCGNGRHPIAFARNFPESQVVGVDLSGPSLACATRLARKFNIENLRVLSGRPSYLAATVRVV